MSFTFKSQLKQGEVGEVLFASAHPQLMKLDGFKSDFLDQSTGLKVELKTDFYDMNKSTNFFFERWGNSEAGKPGGPWQATEHGTDTLVYFFVRNLTYFKFQLRPLVERLEVLIQGIQPTKVPNSTYTTIGYKVPRAAVMDLAEMYELKVVPKE